MAFFIGNVAAPGNYTIVSNARAIADVNTIQAGSTVAAPGFQGALTGDVTGNVSGNAAHATDVNRLAGAAGGAVNNAISAPGFQGALSGTSPAAQTQGTVAHATDVNRIGGAAGGTVNSAITAPSFLYASDERLKQDVTNIDDPITNVTKLRGVGFKWTAPGTNDYGFIAQEVKEVIPEAVVENSDTIEGVENPLTVNLPVIVSHVVEGMKVHETEIKLLNRLVDALYDNLNMEKP